MAFDPDAYLASQEKPSKEFDPDAYLSANTKTTSPNPEKGTSDSSSKGQVYVTPAFGLSQQQTAGLYSFAERASSTFRGVGEILGLGSDETKEQVQKRKALEANPEYHKAATIGGVVGTVVDPTNFIPMGEAYSVGKVIKQSAIMGGVGGFLGATDKSGTEGRGVSTVEGAAGGAAGGLIIGSVMKAGSKLFGKEFLPWKATPQEKKELVEEVKASHPEVDIRDIKEFIHSPEDKHINAQRIAQDLIDKGASKKESGKAIEKNPLVEHYLDAYQDRYEALKESRIGEVKQGEVLPPESKEDMVPKLVETAFKDKETGEVFPTGPGHPEYLKENTVRTQGQGFIDESGNFHSRDDAAGNDQFKLPNKESGNISTQVATHLAGAGIGAMLDPQDPVTGAVLGLAAAHGAWKALDIVMAKKIATSVAGVSSDIMKGAREAVKSTASAIAVRQHNAYTVSKSIVDLVPNKENRESVTHALENPSLVKSLSPEQRKAYDILKKQYSELGERALKANVIKGVRENYINHIVKLDKDKTKAREAIEFLLGKGGGSSGAGKTSSKFGKERTYDTIKDLEDAGFEVKTKDPAELYSLYASSVEKAIAGKNLINHLSGPILAGGKSAMLKLGKDRGVPFGWSVNPAVPGYAIHPDLSPLLSHIFSSSEQGTIMSTAVAISNAVKRLNVVGSFFHAYNLAGSMALSAPGQFVKELMSGGKGIRDAKAAFDKGGLGSNVSEAIKNNLSLDVPMDVEKHIFSHVGALADSLAEKGGFSLGAEKGGAVLEKYTTGLTDKVTWDYMHTGGKLLIHQNLLEKAIANHPGVPADELSKEISKFVNNTFGGLNWEQIASDSSSKLVHEFTNPKSRALMALAAFAPDWSLSTVRITMDALSNKGTGLKGMVPTSLGGKPRTSTDLSRQYMLRTALTYFTVFNGMNLALSGHNLWDEEQKDATRIQFRDGTSMQIAKHAMEPLEWALHPEKTLANKMGFLPKAALIYWGEKQYPFGPDLKDKSARGKMEAIGKGILPFQISAAMNAPEGEGLKRAIAGTVGIPVYGTTKVQKERQKLLDKHDPEAIRKRVQDRLDRLKRMRG